MPTSKLHPEGGESPVQSPEASLGRTVGDMAQENLVLLVTEDTHRGDTCGRCPWDTWGVVGRFAESPAWQVLEVPAPL